MSVLSLQLEAAAIERIQRSDRQDGENQAPSNLQVFLHSSAQFGPSSMRELMVRASTYSAYCVLLLLLEYMSCQVL